MLQVSSANAGSSRRQFLFNGISSFVGILAAIPVSLAFFSLSQPAFAQTQQHASDKDNYALYAQAYSQGFSARGDEIAPAPAAQQKHMSNDDTCYEDYDKENSHGPSASHQTTMNAQASSKYMSASEWKAAVTNSYNSYATNTVNNTKNVNSNNVTNSNNSSTSSVAVHDSKGVVVSSNTTVNGDVKSDTHVTYDDSNNETTTNDSYNTDSNNTVTQTSNSHNQTTTTTTNTTTNTSTIDDSFNNPVTTTINTTVEADDHHGPKPHDDEHHYQS